MTERSPSRAEVAGSGPAPRSTQPVRVRPALALRPIDTLRRDRAERLRALEPSVGEAVREYLSMVAAVFLASLFALVLWGLQ